MGSAENQKPKGARYKDLQTYEIQEAVEHLLNVTENYRKDLENELKEELAQKQPYVHLVRSIEQLIPRVRKLEQLIDNEIWELALNVMNGSAYVAHTRTRDFF